MKALGDEMSVAMLNNEQLQKLFYFFLKKTGNRYEAEELSQETALEAIRMLNQGYKPNSFYAWIWTVARRKYAFWAEDKRVKLSRYENADILDYEDATISSSLDEGYIYDEQISLLQRELALLSKEYREIIVAYYMNTKKISDIATSTGLPEGTVKRKLFESRKNLKEGMQMARINGKRSYAPEDVDFSYNVNNSTDDRPWSLGKRLISKNILLEAYNNPSSVEELSISLGISAPYIEDELAVLVESTIMKKFDDGRYETDFIILDSETQRKWYDLENTIGQTFCPLVCRIVESNLNGIREIGFINSNIPEKYLYWSIFYLVLEKLIKNVSEEKGVPKHRTKRPNKGEWDIVGNEQTNFPTPNGNLCNRTCGENSEFVFQTVKVGDIYETDTFSLPSNDIYLLADIFRYNKTKVLLNLSEQNAVSSLSQRSVLKCTGDRITANFPIFNESNNKEFTRLHHILNEIYTGEARYMLENFYDSCFEELMKIVPARLIEQVKFVVYTTLFNYKRTLLQYAYEKGIVAIPEGPDKSAVTMYMII